uniref:Uncharacterized protein n=1 Tax=Anguilla anguilla TaxID=7936 RepID=A0A0E9QC27_ANGAN
MSALLLSSCRMLDNIVSSIKEKQKIVQFDLSVVGQCVLLLGKDGPSCQLVLSRWLQLLRHRSLKQV